MFTSFLQQRAVQIIKMVFECVKTHDFIWIHCLVYSNFISRLRILQTNADIWFQPSSSLVLSKQSFQIIFQFHEWEHPFSFMSPLLVFKQDGQQIIILTLRENRICCITNVVYRPVKETILAKHFSKAKIKLVTSLIYSLV